MWATRDQDFLPEVREFIRDTKPRTSTTRVSLQNQAAFRQSRLTSYEVHREVRERRARWWYPSSHESGQHPACCRAAGPRGRWPGAFLDAPTRPRKDYRAWGSRIRRRHFGKLQALRAAAAGHAQRRTLPARRPRLHRAGERTPSIKDLHVGP